MVSLTTELPEVLDPSRQQGTMAPKQALSGTRLRMAIAATCGSAFLLFGYDQGVFGAVVSLPSFREQFDEPSPNLEGIMAAIYDIGCFVGCIVAFLGAERYVNYVPSQDEMGWRPLGLD